MTSRTERRNQARKNKAANAHATSTPLSNTLHAATVRVTKQKEHLCVARDIERTTKGDDPYKRKRCTESAVKAWQQAIALYGEIFRSLAEATAGKGKGDGEWEGHADFVRMNDAVEEAGRTAAQIVGAPDGAGEEEKKVKEEAASESEGESSDASFITPMTKPSPTGEEASSANSNALPLHLRTKRASPNDEEAPAARPTKSPKVTQTDGNASTSEEESISKKSSPPAPRATKAKKTERVEEVSERRKKKLAKRAAAKNDSENDDIAESKPAKTEPELMYTDLQAEAEARLKAKAEKKAAKEKEKKRKRESLDSQLASKPDKRRVRSENAAEDDGAEKSKKHSRESEGGDEATARKKAKANGVKAGRVPPEAASDELVAKKHLRESVGGSEEGGRKKRKKDHA